MIYAAHQPRRAVMLLLLALSACAGPASVACLSARPGDTPLYVVDRGWHTEIGVPAELLGGPIAVFRQIFPGARTLMFGFGKRTFMTAPPDSAAEYLVGPFPGPAVVEVIGLVGRPAQSYGAGHIALVSIRPDAAVALSAFLWNALRKDRAGAPLLVGPGRFPGSVFYAATRGYSLAHTCNTWVAEALQAAGLPINPVGDVFSGQVMGAVAKAQCAPIP